MARTESATTTPIRDFMEARGVRSSRDCVAAVLRNGGAMTMPGSIIQVLIDFIASRNAELATTPTEWAMSHGELAAAGII